MFFDPNHVENAPLLYNPAGEAPSPPAQLLPIDAKTRFIALSAPLDEIQKITHYSHPDQIRKFCDRWGELTIACQCVHGYDGTFLPVDNVKKILSFVGYEFVFRQARVEWFCLVVSFAPEVPVRMSEYKLGIQHAVEGLETVISRVPWLDRMFRQTVYGPSGDVIVQKPESHQPVIAGASVPIPGLFCFGNPPPIHSPAGGTFVHKFRLRYSIFAKTSMPLPKSFRFCFCPAFGYGRTIQFTISDNSFDTFPIEHAFGHCRQLAFVGLPVEAAETFAQEYAAWTMPNLQAKSFGIFIRKLFQTHILRPAIEARLIQIHVEIKRELGEEFDLKRMVTFRNVWLAEGKKMNSHVFGPDRAKVRNLITHLSSCFGQPTKTVAPPYVPAVSAIVEAVTDEDEFYMFADDETAPTVMLQRAQEMVMEAANARAAAMS
jgi:hypothetical protein